VRRGLSEVKGEVETGWEQGARGDAGKVDGTGKRRGRPGGTVIRNIAKVTP